MEQLTPASNPPETLVAELRQLIADARRQATATVNAALTLLYWRVGDRIRRNLLGTDAPGMGTGLLRQCRRNWFRSSAAASR